MLLKTNVDRSKPLITPILVGFFVLSGLYLASLYSFLLFHSLSEIFTIVIACGIFMLVWNGRIFLDNNYLLFIGISYLFVAVLDMLHTLTYKGMGVIDVNSANVATQLWVSSRYLQSFSFLFAILFINRQPKADNIIIGYAIVTSLVLASIFLWHIFPACYIEGVGLTAFKRVSEAVVSLTFVASILLLLKKDRAFDHHVLQLLVLSITLNIVAEIFFSLYRNVYGGFNLVGHFFRLTSYYVMYKAIIETGYVKPFTLLFRNLQVKEEALLQQTIELQARNEDLDAFAHTVAHDLKNPLAAIVTTTESLASPRLSAQTRQEFQLGIKEAAFKMGNIIDDLLLFAEVRKSDVPMEPLDMGTIINNAKDRLSSTIREKKAEIIMPVEWPIALGYCHWVEEVWVNYLSNALKYGGEKPLIEFGAKLQSDGEIRFWVRDNGPGLTVEEQSRLFTPFTRLNQLRATGHGLGLSIVRRIVEKLGGQVGVESEVGKGSVFYFTLLKAST